MPICFESLLMGLAEKLALPAFGPDALDGGRGLVRMEDYYLRAVANIANGAKPGEEVIAADDKEIALFAKSRAHLPATVFDETRWRAIVGEDLWPRVVHVLNRGGHCQDYSAFGEAAPYLPNAYGKLLCLYQEKTAKKRYAATSKHYPGCVAYVPVADYHGHAPDKLREDYPLQLITHRAISGTKSRTISNYWLRPLLPENAMLLNPKDAGKLGLEEDDVVRVSSATNPQGDWNLGAAGIKPMTGHVHLTQTIRPGVVSFALGFGNWATGSRDIEINGELLKGDPRRAAGIHANAAMWVDPALKNTCMLDPVGGSVSFYDSTVRLEKVAGAKGTAPAHA